MRRLPGRPAPWPGRPPGFGQGFIHKQRTPSAKRAGHSASGCRHPAAQSWPRPPCQVCCRGVHHVGNACRGGGFPGAFGSSPNMGYRNICKGLLPAVQKGRKGHRVVESEPMMPILIICRMVTPMSNGRVHLPIALGVHKNRRNISVTCSIWLSSTS